MNDTAIINHVQRWQSGHIPLRYSLKNQTDFVYAKEKQAEEGTERNAKRSGMRGSASS